MKKIRTRIKRLLRHWRILPMLYTADFETTTDAKDCRVWSWGVCKIDDPEEFTWGKTVDEFLAFCERSKNSKFYFHNLKFDGEFIISALFRLGFTHVTDPAEVKNRTFTTLISDKGQFYSMKVYFLKRKNKQKTVTFYDSLKILPFSVKAVAKAFGLSIAKGEIDYHAPRPAGYEPTAEELDYLRTDCQIMAQALQKMFNEDLTAMTTGSNAIRDFKKTLGHWKFKRVFPVPDYDADIRQSYKGGFTWLKPEHREKDIGSGIVLDVNSLYPSVMKYKPMPYGEGRYFEGQYKKNSLYSLYVQMLRCSFTLKQGRIPTIQMKNNLAFVPTEYVSSSGGMEVALCLTSVDLLLFLEHYDVMCLEYISGWMFKATQGLFDEYIDRWTAVKIQATIDGNKAMRTLSKLMLNSLYGKFSTSPDVRSRNPVLINGVVHYMMGDKETREPVYIPVGSFITAWARDVTIRAAQSVYDRFIYADTDSLHLLGTELPENLDCHDTELGKWSHELTFSKARYLRAKTYMEYGREPGSDKPEQWKITCAGMPENCHADVTFENFLPGSSYRGKLVPQHVPGGIILRESEFTIQDEGRGTDLYDNQIRLEE